MTGGLTRLQVHNYRALADVDVELGPINVLFGPNGAGKSTLLDAVWFVRDCAIRDVAAASSDRDHGIGLLYDGAPDGAAIALALSTELARYELTLRFAAGRIDPMAGELLESTLVDEVRMRRLPGTNRVGTYDGEFGALVDHDLDEPEKLGLSQILAFGGSPSDTDGFFQVLRSLRSYHSRSFQLQRLKKFGSESGYETAVAPVADNLWSVLRNLESKRRLDDRYETIMGAMRKAFPGSFDGLVIEQTGPNSVYAQFLEKGRRRPILASGVSDGHLQLLILLTALFCKERGRFGLLLVDEPETSLHPWALAVLAEAMVDAARDWNTQIVLATHSPVLISQFDPSQVLAVETDGGRTRLSRLSEIDEIQDLLRDYAAGSLFMSDAVAGQSRTRPETAGTAPCETEP